MPSMLCVKAACMTLTRALQPTSCVFPSRVVKKTLGIPVLLNSE
jgi:hypothetical protein